MAFVLDFFAITKLHGTTDCRLVFQDNRIILVAENGMGKTTIVNLLYYTLSRQWNKLSEFFFDEISFVINDKMMVIKRNHLNEFIKLRRLRNHEAKRYLPSKIRKAIDEITANYEVDHLIKTPAIIEHLSNKYEIPMELIYEGLTNFNISKHALFADELEIVDSFLRTSIDAQILYLPTYRRIEQDLKAIFPDLDTDIEAYRKRRRFSKKNGNSFIELVEFGMDDVQQKVDERLNEVYINFTVKVKQDLMASYLRDILNKNYLQSYEAIKNYDLVALYDILDRVDNSVLEASEKASLVSFVERYNSAPERITEEDQIIANFIYKLLQIYEQQRQEEKDIDDFVNVCNQYCLNKTFSYSRERRKIEVLLQSGSKKREILFSNLSSGEKQIVSLFSHLYLSKEKSFFVIIDEPELSLSVMWQERLLPDILQAYNSGLLAVTHSPFVIRGEVSRYVHGLNEFIR